MTEREIIDRLIGYVATCRRENTREWMEGLAARLNELLDHLKAGEQVRFEGDGLGVYQEE